MVPCPRIQWPSRKCSVGQDSFLHLYKLLADRSTLCLGIVQAAKCFEKFRLGTVHKEATSAQFSKGAFDEFRLAFPH